MTNIRGNLFRGIVNNGFSTPINSTDPYGIAAMFESQSNGVWYDPSDISTLFQNVEGTIPVTNAGQNVFHIKDKSGNNYHLSSPAGPTYQIDQNGKGYLAFVAGQYLARLTATPMNLRTLSGVITYKQDAPSTAGRLLCLGAASGVDYGRPDTFVLRTAVSSTDFFVIDANGLSTIYPGSGLTPLDAYSFEWNTSGSIVYRNSTAGSAGPNSTSMAETNTGGIAIGGRISSGSVISDSSDAGIIGKYYGCVLLGRTISSIEKEKLRIYGRSLINEQ